MNLSSFIRDIPDFPKEGIIFKDITPLLLDANALNNCIEKLVDICPKDIKIDKVVGVESRGFIFGALLAEKLGAGFIPVRKKGKLPGDVLSLSYGLEYGDDVLEIHIDALKKGENILIHDDVLATGGTAKAACELVEKLGGNIVQFNFLITLKDLKGKEKLDYNVKSILSY